MNYFFKKDLPKNSIQRYKLVRNDDAKNFLKYSKTKNLLKAKKVQKKNYKNKNMYYILSFIFSIFLRDQFRQKKNIESTILFKNIEKN